jgi:hypothetical protein
MPRTTTIAPSIARCSGSKHGTLPRNARRRSVGFTEFLGVELQPQGSRFVEASIELVQLGRDRRGARDAALHRAADDLIAKGHQRRYVWAARQCSRTLQHLRVVGRWQFRRVCGRLIWLRCRGGRRWQRPRRRRIGRSRRGRRRGWRGTGRIGEDGCGSVHARRSTTERPYARSSSCNGADERGDERFWKDAGSTLD